MQTKEAHLFNKYLLSIYAVARDKKVSDSRCSFTEATVKGSTGCEWWGATLAWGNFTDSQQKTTAGNMSSL